MQPSNTRTTWKPPFHRMFHVALMQALKPPSTGGCMQPLWKVSSKGGCMQCLYKPLFRGVCTQPLCNPPSIDGYVQPSCKPLPRGFMCNPHGSRLSLEVVQTFARFIPFSCNCIQVPFCEDQNISCKI